jgi:hypothetical protein
MVGTGELVGRRGAALRWMGAREKDSDNRRRGSRVETGGSIGRPAKHTP